MNVTLYSGIALIFLYLLSYTCFLIFKVNSDKFYNPFHFLGGFLTFIFLNSLIQQIIISLILVVVVGVLWEIYEWILWKYVNKILSKRVFPKPTKKDTIGDIVFDFLGGLTALALISLI